MDEVKIKEGRFPEKGTEDEVVNRMLRHMLDDADVDWFRVEDYIAVRCWECPETFRIVVAKIVHDGDMRLQ